MFIILATFSVPLFMLSGQFASLGVGEGGRLLDITMFSETPRVKT